MGNQSSALVGVGLIGRDVDGLLAQTLNETKADWRIFDQKSGTIIPPLELHDLFWIPAYGQKIDPRSNSLFGRENSLFGKNNSLFRQKNSLFHLPGNFDASI